MKIYGYIADDKKLGTAAQQRDAIGSVDVWIDHTFRDLMLKSQAVFSPGKRYRVIIAHARAFGRYKRGFAERQEMLERFAELGVEVQIGKDGEPRTLDDIAAIADFHAAALAPTGIATPKQKRNPGRPTKYNRPEEGSKEEHIALKLYAGTLTTKEVGELIGDMMRCKAVPRATLHEWYGPRPKCEGRNRKTRSDKKCK